MTDQDPRDPVLHLLAGPNGAGKSTFVTRVLQPTTHLPFVNADVIGAERWPDAQSDHAYEAARLATAERDELLSARASFITETVFSHESKVDLVRVANSLGYRVYLHVMIVPEETTVGRVEHRVRHGGHTVPEDKIRARYQRLWALVAQARELAERSRIYDNSNARHPFREVAVYERGLLVGQADWPAWTPAALL